MPTIFREPVTINGMEFNITSQTQIDIMEGWDDTPGVDAIIVPNGGGHGAVSGGLWTKKEKYITLGGMIHRPSRAEAQQAREQLIAAIDNGAVEIERVTPDGTLYVVARLYDKMGFDWPVEEGFRFVAPMVMLDPHKYVRDATVVTIVAFTGEDWYRIYDQSPDWSRTYTQSPDWSRTYQTDGSTQPTIASVENGDAVSRRLQFEVTGPLTAGDWRIVNETTGESMWLDLTVAAGQSIIIDVFNNKATLNGGDVTSYVYGSWLSMAPGSNNFRLLVGTSPSTATMTITAYKARR